MMVMNKTRKKDDMNKDEDYEIWAWDNENDKDEDVDEENACSRFPWQSGTVYFEGTHSPAGSETFE